MNVITILLDTLRRDHLGCYGNSWIRTPNLDRLAERSVVFDNAYIGSYPCMPARQDLWTGRLNFLWRGWSPLEWTETDLATILNAAGKPSMLITDHYHLWSYGSGNYHMSFSGSEFIRGQEMDNWRTDPQVPIEWPALPAKLNPLWERYARNTAYRSSDADYFTPQVFSKATEWIERNATLEDFFLLIDNFDPHEPFDPPPAYVEAYDPGYTGERLIWPRYGDPRTHGYSEPELKHCHALYCGEISLIDHWVGQLMHTLEKRELLHNTMVIVTSDHGFLFGEHDWLGKHSRTLYQHIVHTPLIIYDPRRSAGGRCGTLAQMMDLFPTILAALGLELPAGMHGRSLLPLMGTPTGTDERQIALFGVFGSAVYATDGEWLFVKRPTNDNAPLYWYTDSHFNRWSFGQHNDLEATREQRAHFAAGRFPAWYQADAVGHGGPSRVSAPPPFASNQRTSTLGDELYHLPSDYEQTHNRLHERPDQRARLSAAIAGYIEQIGAPPEQLDRLGLHAAADQRQR